MLKGALLSTTTVLSNISHLRLQLQPNPLPCLAPQAALSCLDQTRQSPRNKTIPGDTHHHQARTHTHTCTQHLTIRPAQAWCTSSSTPSQVPQHLVQTAHQPGTHTHTQPPRCCPPHTAAATPAHTAAHHQRLMHTAQASRHRNSARSPAVHHQATTPHGPSGHAAELDLNAAHLKPPATQHPYMTATAATPTPSCSTSTAALVHSQHSCRQPLATALDAGGANMHACNSSKHRYQSHIKPICSQSVATSYHSHASVQHAAPRDGGSRCSARGHLSLQTSSWQQAPTRADRGFILVQSSTVVNRSRLVNSGQQWSIMVAPCHSVRQGTMVLCAAGQASSAM